METGALHQFEGSFFNTAVSAAADCPPAALAELPARCDRFERLFSKTISGSDVWNINHANGAAVEVSPHVARCLAMALEMYRESGGLYNIAIGAAVRLWNFNAPGMEARLPDPAALVREVRAGDCGKLRLEGTRVTAPAGMEIDLGGIAKGYIADELGRFLRERGAKSGLINLGGNILTIGGRPDGRDWSIGLELPALDRGQRKRCWGVVRSRDNSVVTSGSYERGVEINGRWYHHILDPRSGMPAETGVRSVSVCAPTSFLADALSTPLFLLGPAAGRALAEKYHAFAAYCMEDGEIVCCSPAQ